MPRCANPRKYKFLHFCVVKLDLWSKLFNCKPLQKITVCTEYNVQISVLCHYKHNKRFIFSKSIVAFFKSEKKWGWNLSFILQWLVKKAHCFFHVLSHISAQTYIMYVDILVRKLDCETRHSAYWSFAKNLNFRRCFCFSQFFFWVLAFLNDGKNASFSLFVKGGRWRLFCFWSISLIYV